MLEERMHFSHRISLQQMKDGFRVGCVSEKS